ncbi:hypothetical protein WN55_07843 [Dufourea novaeangliae]|uniref:Uncharacterized protein n=1 Tax=Dufourea novaeangliae TaxID=178035 RepID=A0A154PSU9_DUFNO|nr:hypothetical protein WN55_07843 [Dufourea novaeangliae]
MVAASNKTKTSKTESQAPQTPPDESKEKDEKKNEINLLNPTETTHQVTYDVASSETSHPSNVNDTGKDAKPAVNHTATSNSSVAPLVADIAANAEPKEVVAEVKPTTHSRNNSMSSGVIALVIAMSFGIAIATVYVGMIVWRRYNEYRYGHRELLVNELEFDTNELRHFEVSAIIKKKKKKPAERIPLNDSHPWLVPYNYLKVH